MRPFVIDGKQFGKGHPAFLAAEIGINHNGDMELARKMIDAAAESGANGVKFQNYRTEDFVSDRTATHSWTENGREVVETQYELFKRCELSTEDLEVLAAHAKSRGILFFSTPTSEAGIADLTRLDVPLLKNGSDYLSHLPLIEAMARTGLPTVLSTGMADTQDIEEAVNAYCSAGGEVLALLHCISAYPAPLDEVNLLAIPELAKRFDCPVGFSDHTAGIDAAVGAVAVGAVMIEKHFTIDRSLPGPDQHFSSTPEEFAELVQGVRTMERMLGDGLIGPANVEASGRSAWRLSCVLGRDLKAGEVINKEDILFQRPGDGLPPKDVGKLIGKVAARDLPAGHRPTLEDLR